MQRTLFDFIAKKGDDSNRHEACGTVVPGEEQPVSRKRPAEGRAEKNCTESLVEPEASGEQGGGLASLIIDSGWRAFLKPLTASSNFGRIEQFLKGELEAKKTILPPRELVFSAFNSTPLEALKVVLLGQDPYHNIGQAHGLCFSVLPGVPPPPSLVNMYKELATDIPGFVAPRHGYLQHWAEQGVLMLNATLTVEAHKANSHATCGWQTFTDDVIRLLSEKHKQPLVFLLWGGFARRKISLIDRKRHVVIECAHPSPLSAARWWGSRPFSKCNAALLEKKHTPIDWKLPMSVSKVGEVSMGAATFDDELVQGDVGVYGEVYTNVDDMDYDSFHRVVQRNRERGMPPPPRAVLKRVPESSDDFLRNFFLRNGMHRTMDVFEIEWYEKYGSKPLKDAPVFADNYLETAALHNRIDVLENQLRQHAELTAKTTKQFLQSKKERDFHRANHNRVVQEKNKLLRLLRQTQSHAEDLNPTLNELRQKCEALHKGKTMLSIERDKLEAKVSKLEKQIELLEQQLKLQEATHSKETTPRRRDMYVGKVDGTKPGARKGKTATRATEGATDTFRWPADERSRPTNTTAAFLPPTEPSSWVCQSSFKAHSMPVTKIAMHPEKPAVVTSSDDGTWRLSALPKGELVMSGDGHKSWVSSVVMHPTGTMVATASGDKTVKLWDFAKNGCKLTLKAHCDGVWCLDFQETGLLLASGSLDQTARIWDITTGKCRQTLRGHVDAVNGVAWRQYTNTLCTVSGDKTVSLWDVRTNCCSQTLYGHRNAVQSVAMVGPTTFVASCDADGVVMIWDTRRMEQHLTVACGPYPANHIASDRNGTYLLVSSDDTNIKLIDVSKSAVTELVGHEDGVQCAVFDLSSNAFIVSGGSDGVVRYWC